MDIRVGDRVTYKYNEKIKIDLVENLETIENVNKLENQIEILKIERPKYEVVEEKKELLTEEEKEFLKDMCKYYDGVKIIFNNKEINFLDENNHIVNCPDYPKNMKFQNVKKYGYYYTLKELGLEEN